MKLSRIRQILLDEASSDRLLEAALDGYSRTCAEATGITPDPGFDAWDEDRMLDSGIAINPRAAAHCVTDYRRTVVFIRAVHAALGGLLEHEDHAVVRVLYAGCGPWATLLLPVLGAFPAERLQVELLDVHEDALDAVERLIAHFGLEGYAIDRILADASTYQCAEAPGFIVTETMHKALEQEPQFAVTANLAPQLAKGGIFVPERIDVELCLTGEGERISLGRVLSLSADDCGMPEPVEVRVPVEGSLAAMRAELVTSIRVYGPHGLVPGEAHITLPRPCPELAPLTAGARFRVAFRGGSFPLFEIEPVRGSRG